ncbi:MAG TPA: HPF/RaiA family ribosome-associated protein [Gemmatimonadaceae bacterium]|nr:HPF/RaiA family ribosome-associated protein [Gemmatimonadaceae bacterium]
MEIIFHAHRAVISPTMRQRAERHIEKIAGRMRRLVDAVVRFEQDGPVRRVEVVLHAPRMRPLIGQGFGRTYGPALSEALENVQSQLAHKKRTPKARKRLAARA